MNRNEVEELEEERYESEERSSFLEWTVTAFLAVVCIYFALKFLFF